MGLGFTFVPVIPLEKELQALISLLDDPDELVFQQIRSQIEQIGDEAIPALEYACEINEYGLLFEDRVTELIQQIQNSSIINGLSNWLDTSDQDLLEGLIKICKYQYPNLNEKEIYDFFDRLEKDIWLELNDGLTALEKLKVINHIIFDVYGFNGNREDYNNPDNSFINMVISQKIGNPISLSCIYLILGKRLNLPIKGINLPRHFILAWEDDFEPLMGKDHNDFEVLFYFNPFSSGAVFGKQDVQLFLKEINIKPDPSFFNACSNLSIIKRFLNNLIHSYTKINKLEKAKEISSLKRALQR